MQQETNVLGLGLAVLGALMAGISVFLPLYDAPGLLPIDDNSLVQTDATAAVVVAVLALTGLSAAYDYYRSQWAGVRAITAGAILAIGAVVVGNTESYFELTTYGNEFLPDTVHAKAAIALYVTGGGGAAMLVGGYMMRDSRIELPDDEALYEKVGEALNGGRWEPDPRDPENTERWREGDRWTGAIRPRSGG